jgi:5-methylcytosine-specific restriction endonuclease McrA
VLSVLLCISTALTTNRFSPHSQTTNTSQTCRICGIDQPFTAEFFGHIKNGGLRRQCRACLRERSRAYGKANPERVRQRSRDYQARKQRWKPSAELIRSLFVEQHGCCPACSLELNHPMDVDHLLPTSQGGGNEASNLILMHHFCNQEKHGKSFAQYLTKAPQCCLPYSCLRRALVHLGSSPSRQRV